MRGPRRLGRPVLRRRREQNASLFETLFPWLHPHGTFVPAGDIVAPCSTAAQADAAALQEMAFSQRVAAAVALRKLHYHVVVKPTGVVVSQLIGGTHAPCNLQPMDVVIAVDGTPTPTQASLHAVLGRVKPGAVVKLRVRRGGKLLTVPIRTVDEDGHALVGFVPNQSATFKLPRKVTIDSNGIGGPSAGLAFTLEVMQQLGRNVLHGHKVAATGEIELNGAVAPDRRHQAEDLRRAAGRRRRLPRAGGPEREGRAPLRRAGPHHSGPHPRPGVARPGNAAAGVVETIGFLLFETGGNSSVFVRGNACFRCFCAYHRTSRAAPGLPRAKGTMSKRSTPTCADCYFRRAGLCALPGETICPTFRVQSAGQLAPPPQPRLVPRSLSVHAAA